MEPQQLLLLVSSSAAVNTDVLISLQRREQPLCDRAVVDGFSTHLKANTLISDRYCQINLAANYHFTTNKVDGSLTGPVNVHLFCVVAQVPRETNVNTAKKLQQ